VSDRQFGPVVRIVRTLFAGGTVGGLTDGQLLEQFTLRDEAASEPAFAALVERHGPMVLRVCRSILRNEHDAEDAFQSTFLVLARRAPSLWAETSLGSWLYGVAFRTASCARASRIVHRQHERKAALSAVRAFESDDPDGLGPALHEEVSRLPDRFRAPILLCYFGHMTHEQAARQLGCPVGTIRSRLARARALLKARLTRRGLSPRHSPLSSFSGNFAAPSARLIDLTVKAATVRAARDVLNAGLVSAAGAAMTEGALHTMFVSNWKPIAASLLAVGAITSAMVLYARQVPDPSLNSGAQPANQTAISRGNPENSADHAAEIEELLRQVRRKQAQGDIEGAVRDLHRIEMGAFQWRQALSKLPGEDIRPHAQRPSVSGSLQFPGKTNLPVQSSKISGRTTASGPRSTENRLDELEHKIDRVLRVLEQERDGSAELSPIDPSAKPASAPPPKLTGRITSVDGRTETVEINIGSDDGLAPGHELSVYRVDPAARSSSKVDLGRIRVSHVDPDQAVAKIAEQSAKTSIKEGDQVSPCVGSAPRE
jgi:RNA polymerase sigma factor (sigma-70 family)